MWLRISYFCKTERHVKRDIKTEDGDIYAYFHRIYGTDKVGIYNLVWHK
jgi:hypothetical protein